MVLTLCLGVSVSCYDPRKACIVSSGLDDSQSRSLPKAEGVEIQVACVGGRGPRDGLWAGEGFTSCSKGT